MTSSIAPNNIDGSYPVAGQDNNSQGFRDNFTNIRTNFTYAKNEISDLQSKAVLKSALQGTDLNNDMGGSLLYNAKFQNISQPQTTLPAGDSEIIVDYTKGPCYILNLQVSTTMGFDNWPTVGSLGEIRLVVIPTSTMYTLTLSALSGWNNAVGIEGCTVSGPDAVISFPVSGVPYEFVISTTTGGSTLIINEANKILQPLNNSKENLASGSAANLAVGTSYFSTSALSDATLADGVEGQVKVFAMYSNGGDMVITVAHAGWQSSGSGTITFGNTGDSCTLKFINGKWFCIGNNGAVFA